MSENREEILVPLPENVCPKCGKKYPFIEKYCSACGTKLVEENELGNYRKTEEQRKQYEAEQQRRAEEERRRQDERIESLEEENRRIRQEYEKNKKASGNGWVKAMILAAVIAAAGIIYVKQQNKAAEKPYTPVIVAENNTSEKDKNRIAQLEKEKAEAERKAAAETEERKKAEQEAADQKKKAEEEAAARQAAEAAAWRIKQEKEQAEEAEKKRKAEAAKAAAASRPAKNYKVGDIIKFGSYPYYENGGEKPIEWQILEKYNDGTALVVSKYALDNVKYNETYTIVTWETSTIRKWLNNDFYNKAFRKADKSLIEESIVIVGGDNTRDKVFLLSIDEAKKYFLSDEKRRLYPTPYAAGRNSKNGKLYKIISHGGDSCEWWLRSLGNCLYCATGVGSDGKTYSYGSVSYDSFVVRPAMKINLKNL